MRGPTQNDLDWFAARLMIAVYDINREHRMSVEVKGLADVVRRAKQAINAASDAAGRMQTSAERVTARVSQVEDMVKQLDAAEADLAAAVGQLSNGGPPLDDTRSSAAVLQGGGPQMSVEQSLRLVENQNR